MKPIRKSTWLPIVLLVYLAVMAWIGRPYLYAGRYAYYFSILGGTLLCIVLLHIFLKKRGK